MAIAGLQRALLGVAVMTACAEPPARDGDAPRIEAMPDERPMMVNRELPFHYPGDLYARKLQGNVMLRLFIDANGTTVPDSTRVEASSGYAAFDSAAVTGSLELRFIPAKLRGEPMAMTILFPVYFRHPEAPALPGDSVLRRRSGG